MASPALAPTCPHLSCAEDTTDGHCTPGGVSREQSNRIMSLTLLAVPHSLEHCQPHITSTPGASQHTGPVSPAAAPTASVHTRHRGTSAFSPALTATSRNKFSTASTRLPATPFPLEKDKQAGRDMPRLFPLQCDQRSSSCESQSHCPLPSLSNTLAFKLHVSCLVGVILILPQDTLQVIERKWNTDLQQLNFQLDRRFGSS